MPLKPESAADVVRTPAEIKHLFPWLYSDRLRGIPHFISPAWATDKSQFDPDHYAKTWKKIGFDSVTLLTVHHDGYYLYPSRHNRTKPDRDYFGEQFESCRKQDIRVIAYYSLSLNSLAGSEHPEWRIRDVHDRVLVPDHNYFFHYHWLCINSPFREFAIAQLVEIAENYPVDGLWLDILYLPPHPPEAGMSEGQDTCFCSHCHRAYNQWFQGEHLADALGTSRHDEFRAESYRRFLIDLKRALVKLDRPVALSFNGAGRTRLPFYDRLDELVEWNCSEAHSPEARGIYPRLFPQLNRPFELMSCSELVWSHNVSKPTPLLKLEAAATLLRGGTYTLGINHAPDGRLMEGNLSRLPAWGQWCSSLFRDGNRDSHPTEIAVRNPPVLAARGDLARWCELLSGSHFQFSFSTDVASMKGSPLWIFPVASHVGSEDFSLIESHVRAGGVVFVNGPIPGDSPFNTLAGVTSFPAPKSDCHYLHADEESLQIGLLPHEPVFYKTAEATIFDIGQADVLASLVPPFETKTRLTDIQIAPNFPSRPDQCEWHPGIVSRDLGQGTLALSALNLSTMDEGQNRNPWPRIFLRNLLVHLLKGQAIVLESHAAIEVIVTRDAEFATVWLLNHFYDAGPHIGGEEESVLLHHVNFRFEPSRLGLDLESPQPSEGIDCRPSHSGGFEIELDCLGLIQAIPFPIAVPARYSAKSI